MSSVLTPAEIEAYKSFSQECAKVEKSLYGTSTIDDLQIPMAPDTGIEWGQVFQWMVTIKRIFDDRGVQEFLHKIAPELVQRLLDVESKTSTFLTWARAMLDGLGWGTQAEPSESSGPAQISGSSMSTEKLEVVPPTS